MVLGLLPLAVGAGLGLRPAVVAGGGPIGPLPLRSGEPTDLALQDRELVIAAITPSSSVRPGDRLVATGPDQSPTLLDVIEIEPGPDGKVLSTVAAADRTPTLATLDRDSLVVRWVLPPAVASALFLVRPAIGLILMAAVLFATVRVLARLWAPPSSVGGPAVAGSGRGPAPDSDRRRQRPLVALRTPVLVVPAAVVLAMTVGLATALFTGTDAVPGNVFGTGCFDAQVAGVQTGQVTNSAEGTQTVTLTAVDPARSIAFITVRSNSSRPADSTVLANLASATELELTRRTDDPTPPDITVEWSVVEYSCGVSVQRGVTAGNGTGTVDVAIAAVDPAATFVVTSSVTDRADAAHDGDDDHLATLSAATNLRLTAASGGSLPADHDYGWQVVSFDDTGDVAVQTVTQTLSGTNSESVTLGSPVDPNTTLVLAHAASAGSGADYGERAARVHLSSTTTVEVTRLTAGDPLEVSIQVVSFTDGTVVRNGIVNLAAAEVSEAVPVPAVDTTRATALATVIGPGSLSGGATDMTAGTVLGEASATVEVTDPNTVTVTRAASTAAASFGWQLVEWGGPNWWNTDYPFRQRIDVSTSSTTAPDAYTVPVTFDHLGLVAGSLAEANGDDLRVLRWDGSTWTELDRVLDDDAAWNAADTTIWFRTTDPIEAGGTDSYWFYYGNNSPAAPLADPEQVWLLHEDFESGTLGDFEDRTGATAWYQADPWTARIPLTVQSSQVDANLTNFPVHVELTNAGLGAGAATDGSDIRFTAGDGVTDVPHEIESWNPGTGELVAWVLLPSVSATVDTGFYLYYGAADAPQQQDPAAVWQDAAGVWHLNRDPSGTAPQVDDSSSARRDGLSAGSMSGADLVAGRIGSAVDHDGTDDRLDIEPFDLFGRSLTVSSWVRLDSVSGDQLVFGKANSAADRYLTLGTTGSQARVELRSGATTVDLPGGSLSTATWHHLAATWNGLTLVLYVDGVQVATVAVAGNLPTDPSMPVTIGAAASGERPVDGLIDEVRLETAARSVDWLLASVRNQTNPGTFVTTGATETGSYLGQGTWLYRKPLAVSAAFVSAALTDQPVLVQFVDPEMAGKPQVDGDDVVFTAADGVTRLDHQLESIDSVTGSITAWVRFPSLDASTDTGAFVYYGNPSAGDQQDPEAVFGPDADLVFHGS